MWAPMTNFWVVESKELSWKDQIYTEVGCVTHTCMYMYLWKHPESDIHVHVFIFCPVKLMYL